MSLVRSDGSPCSLPPSDLLLLYFSAHWCPPCKQFTPVLKDFYLEARQEEEGALEIVFISSDRSEQEMLSYMRESHGPWPALPHSSPLGPRLNTEHGVSGIPALVVLARDGRVISRQGREDVMSLPPARCLQKWKNAA